MIDRIAVGDIERDAPPPLQARGLITADRHRVEIEHFDVLRNAPLGRQVNLDVIDEHAEKEVVGIDAADKAAGNLLHAVRKEHVVARLHQRVDLLRIKSGPVGPAFGAGHAAGWVFIDRRMLDELHGLLLDGNHGRLRHAVHGRSAQRKLRGGRNLRRG